MKLKVKHPKIRPQQMPELMNLAELVGEFIEYWGFKRIHGRMWCLLFLSETPLSSIELSQLLDVSPALITQSVQLLLSYKVIEAAEKGKNGLLRYGANPDVAQAVAQVLRQRELTLLTRISDGQSKLAEASASDPLEGPLRLERDKIHKMGEWIVLARLLLTFGTQTLSVPDNPFRAPQKFKSPKLLKP